ncbi:hypothetical protein TH66_01815 [Carbonactinospora thermoautotrophica]|uniref:Alkaline shock response membrane anchor protein AmaP n=1 Tax=Carbonactinospora thermoautotrophica TaxID=1469144 RepID=A0A132N636_9ACTN|nr:hypothetical protein [Carbonactinospora thermoautotrophica]KWX05460.1 hypothetical protein TH66_01815 [Carbonactinospora thermoautotrophica]KWX07089.1 hypothetical protein TR74_19885 [Carbonactinospora thermoautotrophica]
MSPTRRTARLNRTVLVLIGLVLLAAGAVALARGLAVFPSVLGRPDAPLLTPALARYPADHAWFWPAVAAGSIILTLLSLRWLLTQTRTGAIKRLSLEPDHARGVTVLPADAAADAVTDDIATYPGVDRVKAVLVGPPSAPWLRLSVDVEDRADLDTLRSRIEGDALAHLRTALELDTIPTVLRLRFGPAHARHLA